MILIADAGNSKTDWVLIEDGVEVDSVRHAGISPYFDSEGDILQKAIEASEMMVEVTPVRILFFGTGCLHLPMKQKVSRALRRLFPESAIVVSDDLTAAGIALFGEGDGIVAISGTGSNAGVIRNREVVQRTTSLGYLLGDEGSGADLGLRLIRQLLTEKLPPEINRQIFDKLALSPSDLLSKVYSVSRPQTYAAGFIPFLVQFRGYPEIRQLILDAFDAMFLEMIMPLAADHPELPLGFCGSVASTFEDELRHVADLHHFPIGRIIAEPIAGLVGFYSRSNSI
jgi:glucosamine kinase